MENVTEELVRQNGNQAAAVMADYAGQGGGGGGSTGGATISSVVTPQEATEEQRNAVSAALRAAGISNGNVMGQFIPAASIDNMPLAIADVGDDGEAEVLLLIYYHRERGMVIYYNASTRLRNSYIAIDGGFGSWSETSVIG